MTWLGWFTYIPYNWRITTRVVDENIWLDTPVVGMVTLLLLDAVILKEERVDGDGKDITAFSALTL